MWGRQKALEFIRRKTLNQIVNDEMKERIKALIIKGNTNIQIAEKIGIKRATVGYHATRIRREIKGNGKQPSLTVEVDAYNEEAFTETFFGETVAGFFIHEEKMYCVMESGIAIAMKGAHSVPKEIVCHIKGKMKRELKQMQRRVAMFEVIEGEK